MPVVRRLFVAPAAAVVSPDRFRLNCVPQPEMEIRPKQITTATIIHLCVRPNAIVRLLVSGHRSCVKIRANAIKKIMVSKIPTMAIEKVEIRKNNFILRPVALK